MLAQFRELELIDCAGWTTGRRWSAVIRSTTAPADCPISGGVCNCRAARDAVKLLEASGYVYKPSVGVWLPRAKGGAA